MIDKLKHILYQGKYYLIGISMGEHIHTYQLMLITFKNNELKIEEKHDSNLMDERFKTFLKKDYPVILHLEGGDIVNKMVPNEPGYRNTLIFKTNPEEFYFFEYYQKNDIYVSIVRKSVVQHVIQELRVWNLYTIHLSFGPFIMVNLLPFVKAYASISSSNYTLDIHSEQVMGFRNSVSFQKTFTINEDTLSQSELPLIAAFLHFKFPHKAIEFDTAFLDVNRNDFKFKRWFKRLGIFTLLFFLSSLFISNALLKSYTHDLAEKELAYTLSKETIQEINILKDEKALKEKILETSGIVHKNFITQYMLDIGNSVPYHVKLKTLYVIPISKKIRPLEKLDLDFNTIEVSGETFDDNEFNNWVKTLKTLTWVKKLDIVNYLQENKTIKSFVIKIKI